MGLFCGGNTRHRISIRAPNPGGLDIQKFIQRAHQDNISLCLQHVRTGRGNYLCTASSVVFFEVYSCASSHQANIYRTDDKASCSCVYFLPRYHIYFLFTTAFV